MNQKVKDFFAAVIDSRELTRRMSAIMTDDNAKAVEQVIAVARSAGYNLKVSDFLCEEETRPLSADELEAVAGGRMCEDAYEVIKQFMLQNADLNPGGL